MTGARGKRWSVRRASCVSASCSSMPAASALVEIGRERRPATRGPSRSSPMAIRWSAADATARCRCRRTSGRQLAEPDRYQTVYAAEPGFGGRADGRTALHARAAGRAGRARVWTSPRSSWSSGSTRSSRSSSTIHAEHVMHSERYRGRRRGDRAVPPSPAGGRRRDHDACAPSSRRPRTGELERPHPAVHQPAVRLAGGRRDDDQLPPAAHHTADDDRRLRRRLAGAGCTTSRWPSGYRFLELRRRDAARPAGGARCTRCASRSWPTDGSARSGVAHTARGQLPHAVLHAGRHPRRDQVPQRRRLRAARRRDRARQHLPPDAAARRRDRRRASAASARFAGWDGLTLTDSGGFQVFSLEPDVDDDGVTFRSTYDGSTHRFTPEIAVRTQELLGADIQMVLDVCPPLPSPPDVIRLAVERTAAWAGAGARRAHRRDDQALFGIVQGGVERGDCGPRAPSAPSSSTSTATASAGSAWGRPAARCCPRSPPRSAHLPADRPRYLMGVGDPACLVEAVALGVDQFDCVMQTRTRPPRHGADRRRGKLHIKNAKHTPQRRAARRRRARARCAPATAAATSATCSRSASRPRRRLVSLHNIAWTLQLMARMRAAIDDRDVRLTSRRGARCLAVNAQRGRRWWLAFPVGY